MAPERNVPPGSAGGGGIGGSVHPGGAGRGEGPAVRLLRVLLSHLCGVGVDVDFAAYWARAVCLEGEGVALV